jgi:hypothetical protein
VDEYHDDEGEGARAGVNVGEEGERKRVGVEGGGI